MNTAIDYEIDTFLRKPAEMYILLRQGEELGQMNCYGANTAVWAVQNGILFHVTRTAESNMCLTIQICPSGVWNVSNPYDKHAFTYSPNVPWAAQALPYIRRAFGKLRAEIKARISSEHVAREGRLRQALASLERMRGSE